MRRLLATLAISTLVLGACADDSGPDASSDPKGALVSAFQSMADMPGVTVTIRLDASTDSLVNLAAADGDTLTEEDAQKIVDSSLVISALNEADPEKQQTEIIANIAGLDNAVELKVVGETIYARASVQDLAEEFGADFSEIEASVAEAPPGFDFIGAALEGEWVGITGLQQFAEQFGGAAAQASEEQQQQALEFANKLAESFEEHADVTFEGDEDPGAHLVATVNIRDIYGDFLEALGSFGALATGQMSELPDPTEVPDAELSVDFWVADDRVTQIVFDFIQVAAIEAVGEEIPEGVDSLGILVEIEEFDDEVEAPEDFVEVDFASLLQGFMGGMRDSSGVEEEPALPDDFCENLAEAPEDVQAQFEAECPELAG